MKKRTIIVGVVALIFLGCVMFLNNSSTEEQRKETQKSIGNEELLVSSKEGYNSVAVYKQENLLVIDAESESAFFEGAQFTIETQGKVEPEDIEIRWTTLGGGTEKTVDNDLIIAEVKISENNELIADTKINFAKRAFDAIEDILER